MAATNGSPFRGVTRLYGTAISCHRPQERNDKHRPAGTGSRRVRYNDPDYVKITKFTSNRLYNRIIRRICPCMKYTLFLRNTKVLFSDRRSSLSSTRLRGPQGGRVYTTRRKCKLRPRSAARALGVQSRELRQFRGVIPTCQSKPGKSKPHNF